MTEMTETIETTKVTLIGHGEILATPTMLGNPMAVYAELLRLGFSEDTSHTSSHILFAEGKNTITVFVDDFYPGDEWAQYLLMLPKDETLIQSVERQLTELHNAYRLKREDLIGDYVYTTDEIEQLELLASIPSPLAYAILAHSPHEIVQQCLVDDYISYDLVVSLESLVTILRQSPYEGPVDSARDLLHKTLLGEPILTVETIDELVNVQD